MKTGFFFVWGFVVFLFLRKKKKPQLFKKLIQVNLCFVGFVFLSWKERSPLHGKSKGGSLL